MRTTIGTEAATAQILQSETTVTIVISAVRKLVASPKKKMCRAPAITCPEECAEKTCPAVGKLDDIKGGHSQGVRNMAEESNAMQARWFLQEKGSAQRQTMQDRMHDMTEND